MDHADIRGRHGGLFRSSAIHGQQSLPTGNSISGISTASTSSGFTRTITGIKRNVAQNLLKDFDSKVDSDSSLSDIGKESASRRSTSRSQATSSSQLAFIPKPNGNTRYYEQSHQSLPSASGSSKASTSKLSTQARVVSKQLSTAIKASTAPTHTSPWRPFKAPSRITKAEPRKAPQQELSSRRKAPAIPQSSDEESDSKPAEEVKESSKKTKSRHGEMQSDRIGQQVSRPTHVIDTCPYKPPENGVHVDAYLFTPPAAKGASAGYGVPASLASSSSKENKHVKGKKQRSPSVTSKADLEYPKVPDSTKQGRDQGVDRPNDRYKSKANGYEYDDDIDNESTHSIPTLSESLTMSSTASLEEATSKARIAPTSVTDTPKPRAQKKELDLHGRQVSGHHRTPSVSRAIKRGSSAVKQGGDVSRIPLKTSKNERDIAQSILNGRGRSSSPAIERRKGERRAKPAAKEEGHSRSSAARNGIEQRSDATVSSSKSKQDHSQDRTPLAEKASLPSSSKNRKEFTTSATESKTKGKGRVTDLTSSSPEKPRPITLSSSRYHGIDEENEDSLVVAPSIARVEPSRGSSSKAPVSSLVLEEMYTQPVDRGKPSPVFRPRSHKKEERRINSSATRPRAKPAAKHIRPMECSALEKSSQTPRPTTPTSSPRKRLVEVVIESSPSSKKRASRPVKSEVHEEDRKSKRRSIDKEVKRSESPFEQTQVLWRKAAFRDSFDADRDVKMEESDSDSDGDVRLADIREIVLCPFCDRALPERPSRRLKDQLEQLCKRVDLQTRASHINPLALYLPATDTALTCKRHRDESEIIPNGEAAGYPSAASVNWKHVMKRIKRDILDELTQIIDGRIKSAFYESARQEWAKSGGRRNNPRNDYSSFYLELPGYYGQKGFEVIIQVLTSELVSKDILTPSRSTPLDMELYLRRVLVPETAIRLIQADQNCDLKQARRILEDSREYGAAVFSDMDGADTRYKESQYERGQRRKEEEEEASQREDLLSSQGPEAQALRTGQAFIAKMRQVCN